MCGITGIYAFNYVGRMHLIHLEEATKAMAQRGPDAHQTWFDEVVGLGHRRLSIIDTSAAAHQPMRDASGRYTIVFNGEIYNYRSLKIELQSQGISFSTTSDTEVLLYAYIVWGEACLQKLNGFFAFAIYDSHSGDMFIARDRYGIKPLYYYHDKDKVLFGSELKSLMAFGVPKVINKEALKLYFQLTYIPAPHSILSNVQKLRQGHFVRISDGDMSVHQYYDIPKEETYPSASYENVKNDLVSTLRKSVHDRMVADVPLGAFLSGGIDSSIIVALASEQTKDLNTFSIGFKDQEYFDETAYAELVAKKYQTNHHVFKLTNDDLLSAVEGVVDYLDEPFADSSALPVNILSRMTREKVTVALSGDGADEVFSGYHKHSAWLLSHGKSITNEVIGRLAPLWKILPKSRYTSITDTVRKLNKFAELLNMPDEDKYWFLATFVSESKVDQLLAADWKPDENTYHDFRHGLLNDVDVTSVNNVLRLDSRLVLEGDMLTKVDRMSMANSLEVRVPFLDPEVVRMAFKMPQEFKINGKYRKIILREAFRSMLPQELFTRPKHGFDVPLLSWFKSELKSKLDDLVFNEERIKAQGIFEWNEIKRIKRKLFSLDPGDVHVQIWSLFVFQNWYDRYFKKA